MEKEKWKWEIGNGEQEMKMVIKGIYYVVGNRNEMYNFYPRYQMSKSFEKM